MNERPYYYDPFMNQAQTPPAGGPSPVPPGQQAGPQPGAAYGQAPYSQPQQGPAPQGNGYYPPAGGYQGAPAQGYGYQQPVQPTYQYQQPVAPAYQYQQPAPPPNYGYMPFGMPQAPVLDEKAMAQIGKANQERKELERKGNAAGAFLLLFLLLASIFSAVLEFVPAVSGLYDQSTTFQNALYIFYSIVCVGGAAFIALSKRAKESGRPVFPARKVALPDLAVYVVVGFALCLLANLVTNVFINLLSAFGIESVGGPDSPVKSIFGLVLAVVATGVIPGVVEECAFRGGLMQPLRTHGDKVAILISAIIFGAFHGNLQQIPFAFMVGLVLAFVTIKTGSILPAMLIHFVNNTNSVIISYLSDNYGDDTANRVFYILMAVVCVAAILLVLVSHLRSKGEMFRLPQQQAEGQFSSPYALTTGKKMKAFLTAPCMIVAWIGILIQIISSTKLSWF